jgi:hypothetical protein
MASWPYHRMVLGKGSLVGGMQLRLAKKLRFGLVSAATAVVIGMVMWPAAPAGAALRPQATVPGVSLTGIACPTAKACIAVGNEDLNGKSVVVTASTGAAHAWSGDLAGDALWAVACPGKSVCLAVSDDAIASVQASTGAMKVTATPTRPADGIVALGEIACASAKSCYAVGWQGTEASSVAIVVPLSATGKQLGLVKGTGTGIGAIACPAANLCLVSDHFSTGEVIQLLKNGRLGSSHAVPAKTYIQRIVCFQAAVCYALAGRITSGFSPTDELFPVNPKTGAVGRAVTMSGFNGDGMACASATKCLVVGYTGEGSTAVPGVVTVSHGKPGKPAKLGPAEGSLSDVACPTASVCYAVGQLAGNGLVLKA